MIEHLDDVAATAAVGVTAALFPDSTRQTPWSQLDLLDLSSGADYDARPAADLEAGYLLLAGSVAVTPEGLAATAPAALLCGVGAAHRLTAGLDGARLVALGVRCVEVGGGRFDSEAFDGDRLTWSDAIHGGGGRIATRHLWRPQDFASSWTFVDHAILAHGSSLGRHYHDHLEEMFVVLAGRGWMTIGEQTRQIGAGHVTLQSATEGHGMYNPFEEDLDFVRVAVAVPGQSFTTIDLKDDLRARRPAAPETTT